MSGTAFGCIVWCPSTFTSLLCLENFPLGSNDLFLMLISPPGFTTPFVRPSCATHLLSCLEQACFDVPYILSGSISSPADVFTCKLKTSWKWLLVWGPLSFQNLGVNLRLDFGGTSMIMLHTRSWCCGATSSPGIIFTFVTSLRMVLRKGMNQSAWLCFPTCLWWDGCHVSRNCVSKKQVEC